MRNYDRRWRGRSYKAAGRRIRALREASAARADRTLGPS